MKKASVEFHTKQKVIRVALITTAKGAQKWIAATTRFSLYNQIVDWIRDNAPEEHADVISELTDARIAELWTKNGDTDKDYKIYKHGDLALDWIESVKIGQTVLETLETR